MQVGAEHFHKSNAVSPKMSKMLLYTTTAFLSTSKIWMSMKIFSVLKVRVAIPCYAANSGYYKKWRTLLLFWFYYDHQKRKNKILFVKNSGLKPRACEFLIMSGIKFLSTIRNLHFWSPKNAFFLKFIEILTS